MIAHQIHEDDHVIVASDARHNRQQPIIFRRNH